MPKRTPNLEFRDTISQIWNTLRGLEGKNASLIKDELLFELKQRDLLSSASAGRDSNPLDYWGRGYLPHDLRVVDFLAEVGVRRAKLPPEWLDRFLRAAGYLPALRRERAHALFPHNAPQAIVAPQRRTTLPVRRGEFLGRQAEVETLVEALSSGWPVCLIEGMGGAGKTTLALEVAYACAGMPRGAATECIWPDFTFIIWTTAAGSTLTLSDLLDTVAHRLGYPGLTQKPLTEKREAVTDLLAEQPVLMVVDNFETITDLGVADFVVRLPPGVKVLLTSREDEGLMAPIFRRYPPARLRLGGLPDAEALLFLRQDAKRLGAYKQTEARTRVEAVCAAEEATLLPLVQAAGGNPKALALALGYIADQALPLPVLVRDLYAAADSVAALFDHLFRHGWERCGEDARALWRVIPFFTGPARADTLAAAAGLRGRYFHDALEELRGRSLLDVEDGPDGEPRYRAHPLVRAFASAQLRAAPEFEAQARERWIAWYMCLFHDYEDVDWSDFILWRQELENILSLLEWSLGQKHPLAPILVRGFWYFLYIRGHWGLCETYTREAIQQALCLTDVPLRLRLASRLGWLLHEQGRRKEALQQLQQVEAEILALNRLELLEETEVLNYLAQVYLWQDDLERAEAYETQYLGLTEQSGDQHGRVTALYYLARVQGRRGQIEESEQSFRALVREARAISWERGEGYCAYRLARALIQRGLLDEADHWLKCAGDLADRWEEPYLQAHILHTRDRLEQKRGQSSAASALAEAALNLYERLGTRLEIQEVQDLLDNLDGVAAE